MEESIFGAAKLIRVKAKVDIIAITYKVLYRIASFPSLHKSFICPNSSCILGGIILLYFRIKLSSCILG
jgi:hypothetical protein